MKKYLPAFVIVASIILIIVNIVNREVYNREFWMSIVSSVLLIIAMVLTIFANKNNTK